MQHSRIKVAAIFGKYPFHVQEKELKQKTHVVVGTPGRLIDHIERGTLDLSNIKYLVIDEADEMLNMGFIEQIERIIANLSHERVTVLLSATMPQDINVLCSKIMRNPIRVEIEEQNPAADRIAQERYLVDQTDKLKLLQDLTLVENPDSCMIFCNTKQTVDEVYAELVKLDYSCDKLHGGMEQRDRLNVMKDFNKDISDIYVRQMLPQEVWISRTLPWSSIMTSPTTEKAMFIGSEEQAESTNWVKP